MKTFYSDEFVDINVEEPLYVHAVWKKKVFGKDFQNALNKGLDAVIQSKTKNWIADYSKINGIFTLPPEDQKWSQEVWFGNVITAGLQKMAWILPSSALSVMTIDQVTEKVANVDFHYFDDINNAIKWFK